MLIFAIIANGLVHYGVSQFWKDVSKGFILLIVASIDVIKNRGSIFKKIV